MSFRSLRVAALGVLLSTAAHAQTYPTSTFANIIDRGVVAGDVLLGGGTAGPIVGFVPGAGVVTALGIGVNTSGGAALLNGAATSGHCLQWSVTGVQDAGTACGGTGTVTSIAANFTGGLVSVGGSPVTTSGTFAFTVAGTSGGVPYFSSASTWASSAALAANSLVKGGGAGVAPATITTGTGVLTALGITTNASGGAALVNGTPTSGNCLKWSATGVQDNGAACAGAFSISFPQTVGGTTNSGGIPYFSNATTLTTSGVLAANSILIGGGAGASPSSTTTGSGVLTALGVNTGSAGAFVVNGGALGTPSSGVGTNLTGIPTTALTGALQAAQEPAHTGDMTNTAGSLATLVTKTNGVSFGSLATVTPGTGVATALAIATNANGGTGLVNGTPVSGNCLKWSATGVQDSGAACGTGAGSVTSVGETFTGGLISVAGSPVTTAGTFALTVAGTSGGIPYFSSASTWATSAALAANALVIGGGAGAAPASTTTGTGVLTALGIAVNTTGGVATYPASGAGVTLTVGSTTTSGGGAGRVMFDSGPGTFQEATGITATNTLLTVAGSNNAYAQTITGGSVTGSGTNGVGLNITGVTNTSGVVDGAAIFANITNTASSQFSSIIDLQVNSSPKFSVNLNGAMTLSGASILFNGGSIGLNNLGAIGVSGGPNISFNGNNILVGAATGHVLALGNNITFLSTPSAAVIHIGAADAAAPVAQTLGVQSVVAGTTNTAGANWTLTGSLSTGTGTSGDIILKTGATGTTGTAQNAATTALTIKGATQRVVAATTIGTGGYTVSTLPTGVVGDRAYVTDQTAACVAVGAALTGGGAVTCPTFYNGSAWVGG